MSGIICEELVNTLFSSSTKGFFSHRNIAIATYYDYHMLGKRIVYSMLRSCGYNILDYGRVDCASLAKKVAEDKIEILLLSVLMLPSALHIKDLRKCLREQGKDIYLVVGGAPFRFDSELWREVGADAMGKTASDALGIVNSIAKLDR